MTNRKGFTLIELLIVVVIIGILAAIAIPKFAATKDKAKLASVKTDVRNYMTAQEAYFSDKATYGANGNLVPDYLTLSANNTAAGTGDDKGWEVTITNGAISSGIKSCTVAVGGKAGAGKDGLIECS